MTRPRTLKEICSGLRPNDSGLELPRNQLTSRSEATSKEDLRGQLQALVGQTPLLNMLQLLGIFERA